MKKISKYDSTEFSSDGTAQIRFLKHTLDAQGNVIDTKYHRTTVSPGQDINAQMQIINSHLEAMGYAAIPSSEIETIKVSCAAGLRKI